MQETHLTKIQKFFRSPGGRLALYLIIPTIIIAIIAVVAIIDKASQPVNSIKIDNFSELLPDVPDYTRNSIEERLYNRISDSLPAGESVPTSGAMIDPESLYSFTVPTSFVYGDFKVNIASVDQSYIVTYFYGQLEDAKENEGDASIGIYDANDPDFTHAKPIQYLLPRDFSDDYFSMSLTSSSESKSGYRIIVTMDPPESVYKSGKTSEFKQKVEEKVNEFLESNNLNPEDYKFYYKYKIVR